MLPSLFSLPSEWKPTQVAFLPHWGEAKRIGIDIETYDPNLRTTGPSVRTGGFIAGVGFAIEDGPTHYLPIRHEGGGNLPADEVLRYLRSEARKFPGILVGANLNYDLDFLAEEGIVFPNIKQLRDVQIADPLIDELQQSYSLEAIALRHGLPGKDEAQLRLAAAHYGIKDVKADLWRLPGEHVGLYGGFDADLPLRVLRRQERIIDEQDLWRIFDLECRLQPVLLKMKRWGVRIDQDQLARVEEWALKEEAKFLDEIQRSTGLQLAADDVNKKAALVRVLETAGADLTERTESGQIRLDAAVLNGLDHPAADLIRQARKVNKLRTTFAASIRRHMVNGRIHCSFHQLRATHKMGDEKGARFGRISCSDPNLQQQPSRDAFASMWRSIYVPDSPDDLWICADFSQNEPRMTTHYAEAMGLPRAREAAEEYRTNPKADNHDMMTRLIHPEAANWDTRSAEFQKIRKVAKGIFLGLSYNMGGAKLAEMLGLPTKEITASRGHQITVAGDEAQALLDKFDARVPYVRGLARLAEARAQQQGYITTILGRRMRFPKKADGGYDWTYKALNRLIQGSCGDQIKQVMVDLDKAGLLPQLQIHDEVCRGGDMEDALRIKEIMESSLTLRVPSRVDLEVGPSWGQCKEVEGV